MTEANPIITLKAQIKEFGFSKLNADNNNKLAHSGETMYLDFPRMNFVINGKVIDKILISTLIEGAKYHGSKLFSSDDIYNSKNKKEREIDTDRGKAFVNSVLESLEKELAQNALLELWKNHFEDPEIPNYRKTESYRKDFERFYNAGREYTHLLPKAEDESRNYRQFAKEVFKEMFQYAETSVPSNPILEEFVTNCNQAGYGAGMFIQFHAALINHQLTPRDPEKVMNIHYTDHNKITVKSDMEIPVTKLDNPEEKVCDLSTSLEFTLESKDSKDGVTYKDGKLSLTIPKELKNYKEGGKNLFDVIREIFQKLCEKLGFNFERNTQIKHNLDNSLKVNTYLEGVKPTVCSASSVIKGI